MNYYIHVELGLIVTVVVEIRKYSNSFKLQNGIWHSPIKDKISYPSDGNDLCFDIEDQSFWFKNRNKIIYEVINEYSINGPIFDVGGGNGYVSSYLNRLGFDVVLVEPGIDGCLNGRSRGLKNVINSIFDNTHFYPASIPNVGIFDVLEHIENPHQFLKIIHTNMIPDGRLFITVPAFNALWSEEDNHAGHYRRYRVKEICKLIDEYGFEMLYASYFYSFLVIPIYIFRTIPSKIRLYKVSQQQSKKQHHLNFGANKLLEMLMEYEHNKIKNGKSVCFGSSLVIVARKR